MLETFNPCPFQTQRPRTTPGACERCHKYKERCSFEIARHACTSCIAMNEPCRARVRKRMGRRAIARQLPYGSTSIIQLATQVQGPPAKAERKNDTRKRSTDAKLEASPSDSQRATSISERSGLTRDTQSFHNLESHVRHSDPIKGMLDTTDGFFNIHRTFMLGASFVNDFQSVVRQLFARSPEILTESYSVAMKLMAFRHQARPTLEDYDLKVAARCLKQLMAASSAVKDVEEAAVVVLLGQALLVYNTLIPSLATQAITRGTLLNVKLWYPALLEVPQLDAISLTPVLIDTIDCLIRREVPVVRLPDLDRTVVDRFLGISYSLLPLLYDLCELSYEAKSNSDRNTLPSQDADKNDIYSTIQQQIHAWTPALPSNFFTAYTAWEVTVMLTQARTYRLAALLIIHRLRFPVGTNDFPAQRHAEDILRDLSILKHWPTDAATGVAFDFPLLVGTLEMPERGRELYHAFEPFRFRRQHSEEILGLVDMVTAARESGYEGLWFDLAESRLHGITMT